MVIKLRPRAKATTVGTIVQTMWQVAVAAAAKTTKQVQNGNERICWPEKAKAIYFRSQKRKVNNSNNRSNSSLCVCAGVCVSACVCSVDLMYRRVWLPNAEQLSISFAVD